ncbi:FAD-dependent oxidoreductase [Streptomyces sp. HNM0645]|uniref:NAD(P)/FAD-dependent oxidoreductase n=1 Tax=Streptomyces sp. HNM0645 TaxID=2782343 RepID=UPI0024B8647D|nr:FAD-dependent oxidoreductase [Streptomyces sp. HNM0645]MDI9887627.1 FAD-dependent oxidoreductase [Streptomyces sp. HNM0645]
MDSRIVVIGAGMAGARLARQLAPACDVTLLGEEPHAPYNRVLLADVLAGRYGPEVIALPPVPDGRAEVRRGVRAVRIDREARTVLCADGSSVVYDRLVLATGSNPVLPPLRGLDGGLPDGVHPFRTLDDCLALAAAARRGGRAVVVGGGLLGVSAARALAERGTDVVVAHQGPTLMDRHLDPEAGGLVRRHLEELGVEVHTECHARGLRHRGGSVTGVELADGFVLGADHVVLACGVRPRTGLATDAGLTVRQGVVVDDTLTTSDPYVHAVGDCAEHAGTVYGLATPALEQADVLAAVLAASAVPGQGPGAPRYTGTRSLTRLTLGSAGAFDVAAFGDPAPRPGDDVVRLADATRGAYRKVVVRGDRLVGGVLLGDLASVGALARAWEGDDPLPEAPLLHLLTTDGGL